MSLPRSALFACALAGALAGCHRRDRDHGDMPSAKPVESTDQPSTGAMDRSGEMGKPSAPAEHNPPAANPDPWDVNPEDETPPPPTQAPGTDTPSPPSGIQEDQPHDGGVPMSNRLY